MPNLKAIRKRIASVKSTRQVTAAMKMVAAAKLRKVQNKVITFRPYLQKFQQLIPNAIAGYYDDYHSIYIQPSETANKILIITISSNRGLCGAFNINVVKETVKTIEKIKKQGIEQQNIEIFAFGKKASQILKYRNYNVIEEEQAIFDQLTYQNAQKFANRFIEEFKTGKYRHIYLIYNEFKSAGSQVITNKQYLPFKIEKKKKIPGGFIYEPNFQEVLNKLIPETLRSILFGALLDSFAAEQAARMTAMHKATDNATEMIRKLTLEYNKARQAAITKEILEIVAGAEALKNG